MKATLAIVLSLLLALPVFAMPIFRDDRAEAVIVIPDGDQSVARQAAGELADYLRRSTSGTFEIREESKVDTAVPHQIHVGATRAARAQGVNPEEMAPLHYAILSPGDALYLIGHDQDRFRSGTLFAVYHWLDEALGVRWLWPGESGMRVPRHQMIETAATDPIHGGPSLRMALFQVVNICPPIQYAEWMQKHRANSLFSLPLYGVNYGKHFGEKHPEYFALHPNGKRAPEDLEIAAKIKTADSLRSHRYQPCLSNPDLHRALVRLAEENRQPGEPLLVNGILPYHIPESLFGWSDYPYCTCNGCREWDGLVEVTEENARYSRRYGRFLQALLAEGKKADPSAKVVGKASGLHVAAPRERLGPEIVVWITPEGESAKVRRNFWESWRATGAIPAWDAEEFSMSDRRPLPAPEELGADYRFYREHGLEYFIAPGMVADFWPSGALNAYMIARLHSRPSMSPAEVVAEFHAAASLKAQTVENQR